MGIGLRPSPTRQLFHPRNCPILNRRRHFCFARTQGPAAADIRRLSKPHLSVMMAKIWGPPKRRWLRSVACSTAFTASPGRSLPGPTDTRGRSVLSLLS